MFLPVYFYFSQKRTEHKVCLTYNAYCIFLSTAWALASDKGLICRNSPVWRAQEIGVAGLEGNRNIRDSAPSGLPCHVCMTSEHSLLPQPHSDISENKGFTHVGGHLLLLEQFLHFI